MDKSNISNRIKNYYTLINIINPTKHGVNDPKNLKPEFNVNDYFDIRDGVYYSKGFVGNKEKNEKYKILVI